MNETNRYTRRYHWLGESVCDVVYEPHAAIIKKLDRLRSLDLPRHHHVALEGIHPNRIFKILISTYERKPTIFKGLLALEGVGPKAVRALRLVAELVYGVSSSTLEPELYSFAHGGKDGYPRPVDRKIYDETVEFMSSVLKLAKIGERERLQALKRLLELASRQPSHS